MNVKKLFLFAYFMLFALGFLWAQNLNNKCIYVITNVGTNAQKFKNEIRKIECGLVITQPFLNIGVGSFENYFQITGAANEIEKLYTQLKRDNSVKSVEMPQPRYFFHNPNDPKFVNNADSLWHLYKVNAPLAWDISRGSENVLVAVVDDAIDTNHVELKNNLYRNPNEIANDGIDNDFNGIIDDINGADVSLGTNNPTPPSSDFQHGTHVAGLVAGVTNNSIGIASLSYKCKLLSVKCTYNASFVSHGFDGIVYAVRTGAKVINCSWGSSNFYQFEQDFIDSAYINKKVMIVAAAGNFNDTVRNYPAAYNHVVSVTSTDKLDKKTNTSSYGFWNDVAAPGASILSLKPNNQYAFKSGTSMAAPQVSSLMVLMLSVAPNISLDSLELIIKQTSVNVAPLQNSNCNCYLGAGRINAGAALTYLCNNYPVCNGVGLSDTQLLQNNSYFSNNTIFNLIPNQNYCIVSLLGQEVKQFVPQYNFYDVSKLPSGVYFLLNKNSYSNIKFIVE
jgi:serine protease